MHRRDVLKAAGYGLALAACGDSKPSMTMPPDAPMPGVDAAPNMWATGGTVSMTDKATYPDPFANPVTACALVTTTTQGPCTTTNDLLREDVSEGWGGVPVRLAFKVVNSSCNPLAGATIKIWQTNIVGSYSGQTPNNAFCVLQPAYATMNFGRGIRTTAADGTAFFDTCYPGWYRGRAIHIHFQVLMGAASTRVSQLFFPEDISRDIFAMHPEYVQFGQPDTRNSTDGVFGAIAQAERARHVAEIARMTDGAMLASKVVTVT